MTMHRKPNFIAITLAFITASAALYAADEPQHPCAQVRDNTDRLACYDQAFGKPTEPVAAPAVKFGFSEQELARNTAQSSTPAAPTSITAAVTSIDLRHDGKFVVTLDNSQVWSQSEINSQADVRVGDTVTVRQGALGSYLLVTKAGIGTRVRRVK